jgi:hypothetical protein
VAGLALNVTGKDQFLRCLADLRSQKLTMRSRHHKHPSPNQDHTSLYNHYSVGARVEKQEGELTASPGALPPKSRYSLFDTHTDGKAHSQRLSGFVCR